MKKKPVKKTVSPRSVKKPVASKRATTMEELRRVKFRLSAIEDALRLDARQYDSQAAVIRQCAVEIKEIRDAFKSLDVRLKRLADAPPPSNLPDIGDIATRLVNTASGDTLLMARWVREILERGKTAVQ